jgi:PAS domain S-box-containing protein
VTQSRRLPRLRFQLPLDAARLLRARERVRDYLWTLCSDEELVDDVVLCIEEACTNAIRHSQASEPMEVSLALRDGSLIADVRDRGCGFDVSAFDPQATPDLMADGGRGLFLMASIMDGLELQLDQGLHVHMVKHDIAGSCAEPVVDPGIIHGEGSHPRQTRLRALLEEIDEAFIALDWEYRVVHANEAASRLIGLPLDEMLRRAPREFWQAFGQGDVAGSLRDAMELGASSVFDWQAEWGGWLELRFYPTPSGVSVYLRDIEERKRSELAGQELLEDLRRSEERFRATFEQAAVGVVHITIDGRYERVNQRFCDLVGYGRGELERMTFRDITHPDDIKREQHYLDALVSGLGTSYSFEKRYLRRDGGTIWASLTISLLHDSAGSPEHVVAVVQDVTSHKLAAQAMRRYELLSEQARDIMLFVRERDGAIVEANRAAELAYGYSRAELLDLTIFDLRADGRSPLVQEQMRKASRRGLLFETRHRRRDGSDFPVEVSSRGAVAFGGELVLLSVVRDVSERQEMAEALAKERDTLATVMAYTNAQVAYLDDEFRFVLVNEAFATGSGVDGEELIGRSAMAVVGAHGGELFELVRRTGAPAERAGVPQDLPHVPERGTTYWDWRLAPVGGEPGASRGYVLSRVDVTERVRRDRYAQGLNQMLEGLGGVRDPDDVARTMAEGACRVLGADLWGIFEYDGDDTWSAVQSDDQLRPFRGRTFKAADSPYGMEALRTGAVVAVEDCASDPLGRSIISREAGIESVIVAPLALDQRPFTALFLSWQGRRRSFIQAEIDFVVRVAASAAAAMNDARLYMELAERERFAKALNEISAAITLLLDHEEILRRVLRRAAEALGASSSAVSMLEGEAWVPRFLHGAPQEVLGVPIPIERVAYANDGVRTKQVVAVDDSETDARVDRVLQRAWGVRAVVMAPLIVRDDVIGAIFFNHREPHAFSALEIEFTGNVAAIVSGALETARLYEIERRVSTTLQQAFVHELPVVPGLEFAAIGQPAYKPDLVGGDFADVFDLGDGRVAVLVGDVEGRGVRGTGLAEKVRSAVRALVLVDSSPEFVLGKVNELLLRRASASTGREPGSDQPGQFATAVLLVVTASTGEALCASAGHPPPLVVSGRECEELEVVAGTPLGAFTWEFKDERLTLKQDDVVVLYTDGLTDVRRGDEQFGFQRTLDAACRLAEGSLDALVQGLRDAAVEFGGEVRDDMLILAFRLGSRAEA